MRAALRLLALLMMLAPAALANGRFPRAQRVLADPDDPRRLVVGATYGLLATDDGGETWGVVCESSFAGMPLGSFDCTFDRVEGGALLAAFGDAMTRAEPPYCEFSRVLGGDMTNRVVDFSVLPSTPNDVLAILTRRVGGSGTSVLAHSSDGGRNFTEIGMALPFVDNFAVTVDRAPSLPSRVYVSGVDATSQSLLLVSEDGGETFEERPIPNVAEDAVPYIAAVHPTLADTVFVRTDGYGDDGFGVRNADDALLVTRDAGATWQELLRGGAKLYGFALSPAGDRVLAGFGDPRDVTIDPQALGIHSASVGIDTVSDFTRVTTEAVSCLLWTPRGLYVCATDFEVGFHLGFRQDADFAGGLSTFTRLLELPNVVGPLECPAGTTGATCAAEWPATCSAFSASCAGAAGSAAGTAGSAASGGAAPAGGASGTREPRDDSGCGCRVGAHGELAGWLAALIALGLAGTRRLTGRATAASKGKRQS
jgi:MYXO-CTERM domain-containing protein